MPSTPVKPVEVERIADLAADLADYWEITPEEAFAWMYDQFIGRRKPINRQIDSDGAFHDLTEPDDDGAG
jgi:hypothetical protein